MEWMDRPSPTASPDASDDKEASNAEGDEFDDMDGVVEGLLGLAYNLTKHEPEL